MNLFTALIITAGAFAIASLVKPSWPLCPVAVLLVCVALLVR